MARPVKDGLSLLIGAGVGVGLMYLFDPDLGQKRRKTISTRAGASFGDATDSVKELASSVKGSLSDSVSSGKRHLPSLSTIGSLVSPAAGALKEAYEHLGEHLHGHIDQLHGKASDAVDQAHSTGQSAVDGAKDKLKSVQSKLVQTLSDRVEGLTGPAKEKYAKALKDLTLQLGRDEDHHYIGQTACALGSLALGAGVVYFLDPDKGHDRRDNMAETVSTTVSEIGTFFRKVGTRLIHQGQGLVDQAQDRVAPVVQKANDLKDRYLGDSGSSKSEFDSEYNSSTQNYSTNP